MNERDEKLKWLKENLKTGIGCAKDPRHPHAFPAFSPEVTLKVTVSEKDNREKIKALSQNLGVRPAVKFEDLKQNEKNSAQRKGEHMKERTSKSDPHADSVGQKLKEFLDGV